MEKNRFLNIRADAVGLQMQETMLQSPESVKRLNNCIAISPSSLVGFASLSGFVLDL